MEMLRSSPTNAGSSNRPSTDNKNSSGSGANMKWPCSNCHTMVGIHDTKCPTCHGVQVRVYDALRDEGSAKALPPLFGQKEAASHYYLERVKSPTASGDGSFRDSPFQNPTAILSLKPMDETVKAAVASIHPMEESKEDCRDDNYNNPLVNDGDDLDLDLDAAPSTIAAEVMAPGNDVSLEETAAAPDARRQDDEWRPIDPVAATLLSAVPSPVSLPQSPAVAFANSDKVEPAQNAASTDEATRLRGTVNADRPGEKRIITEAAPGNADSAKDKKQKADIDTLLME